MNDSNLFDESIMVDYTKQELVADNLKLKTQIKSLIDELENLKQQLHKTERECSILHELKNALEGENETLQSETKDQKLQLANQKQELAKLKEQQLISGSNQAETIEAQQLSITYLEKELNTLKSGTLPSNQNATKVLAQENENLQSELFNIKIAYEDLKKTSDEIRLSYQEETKLFKELQSEYSQLNIELKQVKEILNQKSDVVKTDALFIESLQEELALLKSELADSKSSSVGPHKSKGNSLFGEVYDSRQNLQKKISQMKHQYIDMKSKYSRQVAEHKNALEEKIGLSLNLQYQQTQDFQDLFNARYNWQKVHELAIEDLKKHVASLQETIKTLSPNMPLKDAADPDKCINSAVSQLFDRLKEESLESSNIIKSKTATDLETARILHDTQRELFQLKHKLALLEIEKKKMQLEIESVKLESQTPIFSDGSIDIEDS